MKENFFLHNTIKKQVEYNIIYQSVDSLFYPYLDKKQFNFKTKIISSNILSELNIIKAQKSILLYILFLQKSKSVKNLLTETFNFKIDIKPTNLSLLFFIFEVLQQKGVNKIGNNQYIKNYKDLLLELSNLNFHKINLNSLSDINTIFDLNKNNDDILNKWLINETFNKKRS